MSLYVGTSGYSYPEWKGTFYPKDMKTDGMLRYYGERFRTVEINNTFYQLPKATVLEAWASQVPAHFRFVIKASRGITHIRRLKNVDEPVALLMSALESLSTRLGAVLFQLPPNLKKDAERLRSFLEILPPKCRVAVEFRNPTWFDDETFDLLRAHKAALCIAEAEEGVDVPCVATASWGYLRLRRPDYSDADLKGWIKQLKKLGWKDSFVFFKHEDAGVGPRFASRFIELAG
jgi:uncharacterized protein YecE (DUF72 family)